MKFYIISILCFAGWLSMLAETPVLQIFDGKDYDPVDWEEIENITYDSSDGLVLDLGNGTKKNIIFSSGLNIPSGETLPLIEIFTDEYMEEIPNKTTYQEASINIKGWGKEKDFNEKVTIKGRGNTSWMFPKKPYRLKFNKKISICGLPKAKSYVLLANYTDASLIQNALAFKLGQMLELPYTNESVPVDVKLNGIYKGSYLLTNKPGINAGSVDIDEDNSVMWELDIAYDEEYKFRSPILDLPVMLSDPEMDEAAFEEWKADFIAMEEAAVNYNAAEFVDMDLFARYYLVYEIMKNSEIGWPKSVKLFKTKGQKYIFGPLWDFDTAMGKVWNGPSYTTTSINERVWKNLLFCYLEDDPIHQEAIVRYLGEIKSRLPEILDFIDDYADRIRNSAIRNQTVWPESEDFDLSVMKMKDWLQMRFEALEVLYPPIP